MRDLAKINKASLPDSILNKPTLLPGLDFIWRAFWELSTDRNYGMSEGPIPWTAMNQWAMRYGIHGDEFNRFVILIKNVDMVYIEKRGADQKRKMNKNKGGKIGDTTVPNTKGAIRTKGKT